MGIFSGLVEKMTGELNAQPVSGGLIEKRQEERGIIERKQKAGRLARRNGDRITFLIDTSGSMSTGGVEREFANIHGDFLDALADTNPQALVRCVTFDTHPTEQYDYTPVSEAKALRMNALYGTCLPNAVIDGIGIGNLHDKDTVIIITDGDVDNHEGRRGHTPEQAGCAIRAAKGRGAKFLFLIANMPLNEAITQADRIGISADEVKVWEHSAESLRETMREVGEVLALGASS